MPQERNGVEYYDPKFIAAVTPLKPGWVRYPAGTASLAFDWTAAHMNVGWMSGLIAANPPLIDQGTANTLSSAQILTQAKGGVSLPDFAEFAQALNANAIICVNGYTDNNPSTTQNMASAAQTYGLKVLEWELSNEAYLYPQIYSNATAYAQAMYSPYATGITAVSPTATIGLFYAGLFPGMSVTTPSWDSALATYPSRYWNAASIHIYPMTTTTTANVTIQTLNGVLAHGSSDYITNYLNPMLPPNTPIYITEMNCCTYTGNKFLGYLYNGIFLAEYIARMSTVPNVKAVGVNSLYTDNYDYHGAIQSVNDYEPYLMGQVAANPGFSTDTSTDPNTPYQFYMSAPGVALQIANMVINSSNQTWPTTVTGSPTVATLGYDGAPIPAIYAQGYRGPGNAHYILITNKSNQPRSVSVQLNGSALQKPLIVTTVSNTNAAAMNTAAAPNAVQIQNLTAANPLQVGPYSVTAVTW
ncbi:MAG: hypothetical protein U0Q18_34335 [Bryobacteraceae bacterium]